MDLTKQTVNYWVDIHSVDRLNTDDPKNVLKVKIQDFININSFSPVYLSCPYLYLSPTLYNVSSYSGNNTILWVETDGITPVEFEVSIQSGNYNISNFLETFKTALESASPYSLIYELNYTAHTGKLTITNNLNYDFTIKIPTNKDFNLGQLFGISLHTQKENQEYPSSTGVWTSPDVVNFSTFQGVYLRSNLWRNQTYETLPDSRGKSSNILNVAIPDGNGFVQSVVFEVNQDNAKIQVDKPFQNIIEFFLTSEDERFKIDINGEWGLSILANYDNPAFETEDNIIDKQISLRQLNITPKKSKSVKKNII